MAGKPLQVRIALTISAGMNDFSLLPLRKARIYANASHFIHRFRNFHDELIRIVDSEAPLAPGLLFQFVDDPDILHRI